ncbi:MAG: class I SAM-dependent methyltransferase [Ignavibacteriae bacterium]|nr:class I SAM-dependent methyltransferase [Ignavibacteriota bacterium]
MSKSNLNKIHNREFEDKVVELIISDIKLLSEKTGEFIESHCPACLNMENKFYYSNFGLNYVKCNSCGTVYLNPCPDEKTILWYLNNSEGLKYWHDNMPPDVIKSRKEKLYTDRANFIARQIDMYKTSKSKFLDVGGGRGEFVEILHKMNLIFKDIVIIEPQPLSFDIPNVEVIEGILEDYQSDRKADIITAFEVLEHIIEPDRFLKTILNNLSENGLFILSTPNINGFETSTLKEKSHSCWFDHVRLYNTESLKLLLNRNGFEVLDLTTPGELDVEIVQRAYSNNEIELSDNPSLGFLMNDGYKHKDEFQDFLVKNKLSSHIKCVAKKK